MGTPKYTQEFISKLEEMAASGMKLWDIDCKLKLPLGTTGALVRRARRMAQSKEWE